MSEPSECRSAVLAALEQHLARPGSRAEVTYRLQFHKQTLTFAGAADIVPYLHALGISHVYASPYLMARPGSEHGYAIVDYSRLNPELGDEVDFETFVRQLHEHGMGQILDVVPNHMSATAGENPWWTDVLENGPGSTYADYFDIDWNPIKAELRNKILLPVLERQFGDVLEAGQLRLVYHEGAFQTHYFSCRLPVDPKTYDTVLTVALDAMRTGGANDEDLCELESIVTAVQHLPDRHKTEPHAVVERRREKEMIKDRLRRLVERSPQLRDGLDGVLEQLNGRPDNPASYDDLERLLNAQVYRLAHWKAASDEINYRRFFDVNELAAVCTEEQPVFDDSHALLFELLADGKVDGLRIDHVDGLYDPLTYLARLQRGFLRSLGRRMTREILGGENAATETDDADAAWSDMEPWILESILGKRDSEPGTGTPPTDRSPDARQAGASHLGHVGCWPLYVVVEKILGPHEPLPADWPVAGTTGYEFLNAVNGVFVDPAGLADLLKIYRRFTGESSDFEQVAYRCKRLILRVSMASELHLLAHRLNRISERHRSSRDFTLNSLRASLREVLASFPVYRTYVRGDMVSERDREVIGRAVARAKRRNPAMGAAEFDFIRGVLLSEQPPGLNESARRQRQFFIGRFQQVTSPVVAKGVEDTAFYRCYPLASINDVGGEPARACTSVVQFHEQNQARQTDWPASMTCTSTHDTKRSEDTRARINVLSEIPQVWRAAVNRWARWHRQLRRDVDGQAAPSANDQYLFYQTLVGIWPLEPLNDTQHEELIARMARYMDKATHEAKAHTSWLAPDADYDEAVRQFVEAALRNDPKNRFLADFRAFHERVIDWGLYSALSQVVLKLTSPGVPDIYQGQELWDFSLVDPDNRGGVDFALRCRLLNELEARLLGGTAARLALARELGSSPRDPRLKFFVTWQILQFRRQNAELFRSGQYVPLVVAGSRAEHVCAFAWSMPAAGERSGKRAIVLAPRLLARLTPNSEPAITPRAPLGGAVWTDTWMALPESLRGSWRNVFTGQEYSADSPRLDAADVLADLPVAMLT